ncbi:Putative membrane protein mmpS4 (modular protein) [uncultured Mycobacterium sp.]|uniref:Putative membrane protein mmpS4 (Modular protein) n=1 Tax=uncultured Mycobacterium sp. TaxID=171292 RepID=A0A1Y5PHZ9_9MYCO|nr:Putative membrane protein mmpS4 (modular protein) [uncultured Mycobacterium sp.]SBS75722.1 Putative membrane protein mmpS4 (modular protein) [uncultured Mycobacterium sp.]
MGAVVEGGLPDIEPTHPDATTAGPANADTEQQQLPPEPRGRQSRPNLGTGGFRLLGKLWIPLVVLAVVGAGGFTVSRLHGIFGNEKSITYGDTRVDDAKPFNPKHMQYEVFGPPGTVAQISFFNGEGSPQYIEAAPLPWTLNFPIVGAASVGSVAAQGDSDSIGCRILIDGVVKSEKTSNEVNAFAACMLKAA